MEGAIRETDGINPQTGKHYSEYMDVDSWVSQYLIDEVFSDPDAPAASVFLYKDSDKVDPLIYFGPAWDYDRALGGYGVNIYYIDDPQQWSYRGIYADMLLRYSDVVDKVRSEYRESFQRYVEEEARGLVRSNQRKLEASVSMDKIRWPGVGGYYSEWEANGDYIISFLETRIAYLNDLWLGEQQYHTVTFLDYYGNVYNSYQVKHGEYLKEVPNISAYAAIFSGWYSNTSGKLLELRLPVLEDTVYRSEWIEADILLQNGLNMAGLDVSGVDVEALESLLEAVKERQEADHEQ